MESVLASEGVAELVAEEEPTLEDGPKQTEDKEEEEKEAVALVAATMVDQPVMPVAPRRFPVWCRRVCAWCTLVASRLPPSKCTRAGAR